MKKRQQYYWDIVKGGDRYVERLSITLFSCLEVQYLCYDKGLSARHYDDQDESDDGHDHDHDHDTRGSVVEEEEEVQQEERRQWDALPSLALLNIFCKSELKDRLQSIPLVCKSWKTVTDDPRCWSSMIPDSVSPEDAFIKKKTAGYIFPYYSCPFNQCIPNHLIGISRLFKEEEGDDHEVEEEFEEEIEEEEEEVVSVGLSRLRTLIKKSGGGAAITTFYDSPFTPYHGSFCYYGTDETYDKILHLIANCCANLKHISFNAWGHTSMEAVLQLLNKCKKLELIELFYDRDDGFDEEQALLELLSCLPNLRGFRIIYECNKLYPIVVAIATHLPQLKLLSLHMTSLTSKDLSVILVSCFELEYLHVYLSCPMQMLNYRDDILHQASSQIPEFHYDNYKCHASPPESECYNEYHSDSSELMTEDELNCFEDYCDDWDHFLV